MTPLLIVSAILAGIVGTLVVRHIVAHKRSIVHYVPITDADVREAQELIYAKCGSSQNSIGVARRMGIRTFAASFLSHKVLVKIDFDKRQIYVDANAPVKKRQNAIARGVGHILLNPDGRGHIVEEYADKQLDIRALRAQEIADFILSERSVA